MHLRRRVPRGEALAPAPGDRRFARRHDEPERVPAEGPVNGDIHYKTDLAGADWREMKETLRVDAFDNGRTPEQLERSFANSFATVIAYADGKIIGTARVLSDGV